MIVKMDCVSVRVDSVIVKMDCVAVRVDSVTMWIDGKQPII